MAFTAAGSSSIVLPASAYKYQFSRSTDGGTTWTNMQPWSASATYDMVGNVFEGFTLVKVDVTTEAVPATVQASFTTNPGYGLYGPATGVVFPDHRPGEPADLPDGDPRELSSRWRRAEARPCLATSTGSSSMEPRSRAGAPTPRTSCRPIPSAASTPSGSKRRPRRRQCPRAPARGSPRPTYVINYPEPSGVTISASPTSPQLYGTVVTFTAVGQPGTLPPSAFNYRFKLGGAVVQNWSKSATYVLPSTFVGTATVMVEVNTENVPVTVVKDATTSFTITTLPATGVTLSGSPVSPVRTVTPVLFTAQGIGGAGLYQYRFDTSVNGAAYTVRQAYSTTNTWTLPAGTAPGTTVVRVLVRTNPAVAEDRRTQVVYTIQP